MSTNTCRGQPAEDSRFRRPPLNCLGVQAPRMMRTNDRGIRRLMLAAGAGDLPLVSITSRANAVDENCQVVLIGEDYSPVADPKPVNLFSARPSRIAARSSAVTGSSSI